MGIINRGSKSAGGTSFATGKGTIKSTEVDTDIDTVYNEVNGKLNGENISGIASTKLTDSTSTGRSLIAAADAEAARNVIVTPGPAQMRGYIAGYTMSQDSGDTEHDVNITAGVAVDTTQTAFMQRAEITKKIDTTWVAGDDAGGYPDNGASLAADTWYHFFVLSSADGTTVDAGFDASITASALLADVNAAAAGLTLYRRVGSVLTDSSSNIVGFSQVGDLFVWDDPKLDVDADNIGTSLVQYAVSVPLGVQVLANFNLYPGATDANFYFSHAGANDEAPSLSAAPLINHRRGSAHAEAANLWMLTTTASQINVRADVSGADVQLSVLAYRDSRGKDD